MEHCVSKCALSHVLANHLSLHSPTTQHLHPIGWLNRSLLCPRVSQRANQEAQPQRPLTCLCSRCTFICEKLKSPIMLYGFGLQMHHLSKCVSKILSGICLKRGVNLEVKTNHKFACHVWRWSFGKTHFTKKNIHIHVLGCIAPRLLEKK